MFFKVCCLCSFSKIIEYLFLRKEKYIANLIYKLCNLCTVLIYLEVVIGTDFIGRGFVWLFFFPLMWCLLECCFIESEYFFYSVLLTTSSCIKYTRWVLLQWKCYSFSNQTSEILLLLQGYQGMVDGGDNIVEVSWESVSSILQVVSVRGWDPNPLSLNREPKF